MLMSIPGEPNAFEVLASLRYGAPPDVPLWDAPLFLDLLLPEPRPEEPVPAVAYFHGGGWRHGDKSAGMLPWHSPLLAANGFVAVNVGYRLTDLAPFPAQIHDAKAAIRWLREHAGEYGIDPDRIGVWGDSAGGHLAALLGLSGDHPDLEGDCGSTGYSSAVQAVIARCAPTDFRGDAMSPGEGEPTDTERTDTERTDTERTDTERTDTERSGISADASAHVGTVDGELDEGTAEILTAFFGGPLEERKELRASASPLVYAHAGAPPFFVVHGTDDETVPYQAATSLVGRLRALGVRVEFDVVDGGHHNLLTDVDEPWGNRPWTDLGRRALEFFDTELRSTD